MKRLAFVSRRAPRGKRYAAEGLQAAKMAVAFDVPCVLILLDEAVWWLVGKPTAPHVRELLELRALGCQRIVADAEALAIHGIETNDVAVPVEPLSRAAISAVLASTDVVLTY